MKINGEIITKDWMELEYRNRYGCLSYEARGIDNEAVERAITSAYEELTGEYSSETKKIFEVFGGEPPVPCTLEEALCQIHAAAHRIVRNNFFKRISKNEASSMYHVLTATNGKIVLGNNGPILSPDEIRKTWNNTHPEEKI